MRNIIYFIALGITCLLSACQDVTVGYLETEKANYTIDTLHIIANAKQELQRLKGVEEEFYSHTQELQDEIQGLQAEIDDLNEQLMDEYDQQEGLLWDEIDEAEAAEDWDRYDELMERIMNLGDELDAKYDPLKEEVQKNIDEKNEELKSLAEDMGIGSLAILQKQIADYQLKIDYKLPWVSAPIEGVLGTQPLLFTVINVKSDNIEAAEKFMDYIGVFGDGSIYVELEVNVPPGNYTVSLEIKNEGRSRILEDAFTFVVDTTK